MESLSNDAWTTGNHNSLKSISEREKTRGKIFKDSKKRRDGSSAASPVFFVNESQSAELQSHTFPIKSDRSIGQRNPER